MVGRCGSGCQVYSVYTKVLKRITIKKPRHKNGKIKDDISYTSLPFCLELTNIDYSIFKHFLTRTDTFEVEAESNLNFLSSSRALGINGYLGPLCNAKNI